MKTNRSLRAFWRRLFARSFLAVLLYLLQPGVLLVADEQDDRAKLSSLHDKVIELSQAGKFKEAIPIAQEFLELTEKTLGPDQPGTATALNNLGALYYSLGNYTKAESLYQRALKIDEKALGPDHPDTAMDLKNLAELYKSMGDNARAEPLFRRALKIKQKAVGPTPEPSAASSPDFTGSDGERGVEEAEPKEEAVPEFPWPPPKASASDTISRELLLGRPEHPLLRDAAAALDLAFRKTGYGERSYYNVPGGFAMASRIEQMNPDGTPKEPADRWSLEVPPMRKFSFSAYLTALFRARPGYYRVIVFVVTSHPFSQSSAKPTSDDVELWATSGLNALPEGIASRDYTSAHRCTALIYEFKRTGTQHAEFVDPSEITGQIHLEKSGLLAAFNTR